MATLVLLGIILLLAVWVYDKGRSFAGFDRSETEHELTDLRATISQLVDETARLRDQAIASESRLQIERTAQVSLAKQIQALETDNNRLREDLAVFERLAAADPKASGVSIHRLEVEPEPEPGAYRYRMLLSAQGARDKDFQGRLSLTATVLRGGKTAMLPVLMQENQGAGQNSLIFRHFRRVEGSFKLPPDVKIQSVEAAILQGGSVLASQRFTL